MLLEQSTPGGAPDAVGLSHNGLFVHRTHDAITHQPVAIHHDRLHVTALPLMYKAGDDAQQRYQVRLAQIDHDQIGFVPRCEPASVWHTEGLVAVPRGPQQGLFWRRVATVLSPYALHKQSRTHDFDHVFGHI